MKPRCSMMLAILFTLTTVVRVNAQDRPRLRLDDGAVRRALAAESAAAANGVASDGTSQENETLPVKVVDKKLKGLAAVLYTSMAIDTKSTYDSHQWCPRCVESDPYTAPFIKAGPATAYTAGAAFDTGIIYLAAKMRTSSNPAVRRIWFALPLAIAAGHAMAAYHNYYGLRASCAQSLACGALPPQ